MITRNIKINSKKIYKPVCLTIGNFDGLHRGHKYVLKKLISTSKKNKLKSAVLSFSPHPRKFFTNSLENFNIITETHKVKLLKLSGVQTFYKLTFDKNVASMQPLNFVRNFLVNKLNIKSLIIGENFRFGKNRKGDINLLKKYSLKYKFDLIIIKYVKQLKTNEIFSSSLIRENIINGKVNKAKKLLGRPWSIKGRVKSGDKRARKMGFPTANILSPDTILPKKGVYAVYVIENNNKYCGIANFGRRPTFKGRKSLLEVNIFNFKKEIYGKELTVEFLAFIREEIKFKDFNTLKKQVKRDVISVKSYFKKTKVN